ncbi:MAG: TlpA family protein disulfide reductase, partial [Planctomycetaceae bacterium]|nr:TlpA family protein disulfide reductase [Planctomycetaceae bacterium]
FLTYRTQRYSVDGPPTALTVELQPTEVQSGRVLNSDGTPAASAKVSIVRPEDALIIGSVGEFLEDERMHSAVNADGVFLHGTQTTRFAVVAATEEGYAEKYLQPRERVGDLKLKPWSRVEGTLIQDGKPVPDASIMLQPIRQLGGDNPHVQDNYQTRTDLEGKFVLERVPPVPSVVSSWLSSWNDFPITSNQSIPLDLQPGKTRSVKLGGDGLQVDGKVRLLGDGADKIEFRYGIHTLVRVDAGQIPVPEHAKNGLKHKAGEQQAYEEKLSGVGGDLQGMEQHSVKLNPDGSMLINGVRPGRYRFLLKVYEPPTGCLVDPIGYGFLEFHTDDYKVHDNRINLGTIDVVLKTIPKASDQLPNFSWQDLDGKNSSLTDYQGQFVLLDFWATWCGPCIQAMPEIKKLHDAAAVNQNLKILSLSLDEDIEKAKAFAREQRFDWSQGFVGDITASSTGTALGISSVPLYILLDGHGRIVARSTSLQDILLQEKLHHRLELK